MPKSDEAPVGPNVLFSGLGFRGTVSRLLEVIVHQEHTLVTSEYILEELRRKIGEKFQGAQEEAALDLLLFILSRIPLEAKKEVQ